MKTYIISLILYIYMSSFIQAQDVNIVDYLGLNLEVITVELEKELYEITPIDMEGYQSIICYDSLQQVKIVYIIDTIYDTCVGIQVYINNNNINSFQSILVKQEGIRYDLDSEIYYFYKCYEDYASICIVSFYLR